MPKIIYLFTKKIKTFFTVSLRQFVVASGMNAQTHRRFPTVNMFAICGCPPKTVYSGTHI
jgi:hypothetical protein